MLTLGFQVAALEKEVKELRARATEKETGDESASALGPGLGGRLMIGGPT